MEEDIRKIEQICAEVCNKYKIALTINTLIRNEGRLPFEYYECYAEIEMRKKLKGVE